MSRLDLARETLVRFTLACEADPLVVAAFLGGSLAAGTADEQSDLDLYVLVREDDYPGFFERRETFLRTFGEVRWWTDHRNFEGLGFDMVPFVMADGVDGELALAHESNFRATHGGPHEVLVDKAGILSGVSFPLVEFDAQLPDSATVEMTIGFFWTLMRAALKCWTRGNWWMAASYVAGLRSQCLTLARSASIEDPEQRLLESFSRAERSDLAQALRILLAAFLDWGPAAATAAGVEFPHGLWAVSTPRIARALGDDATPS